MVGFSLLTGGGRPLRACGCTGLRARMGFCALWRLCDCVCRVGVCHRSCSHAFRCCRLVGHDHASGGRYCPVVLAPARRREHPLAASATVPRVGHAKYVKVN